MKKYPMNYCTLFFLLPLFSIAQSTYECEGTRYLDDITSSVSLSTIQYGEAIDHLGKLQSLYMDVYEPEGDPLPLRPLIVLAHGGAYITGEREDMADLCQQLAKKGYVAASIDYRLWPVFTLGIPDSLATIDIVLKSIKDLKAAIRYFQEDIKGQNKFRIDPTKIIVGGGSAGAIMALHAVYLDEGDDIPTFFWEILKANGGLEASIPALAVLNFSGALYRREWIQRGNPPLLSMHGTEDDVVPYGMGIAGLQVPILGRIDLLSIEGSAVLHEQAEAVDIPNLFIPVIGAGHEDAYSSNNALFLDQFLERGLRFMKQLVCTEPPSESLLQSKIDIYPNPSNGNFTIEVPTFLEPFQLNIYDAFGRILATSNSTDDYQFVYQANQFKTGLYFVQIVYKDPNIPIVTKRVIIR